MVNPLALKFSVIILLYLLFGVVKRASKKGLLSVIISLSTVSIKYMTVVDAGH